MAEIYEKMPRVTKNRPCPVCGKPDWCLMAEDGSAIICSRIEDGSKKRCGDAGWLHVLSNRHNRHNGHRKKSFTLPMKEQLRDFGQLSQQYQHELTSTKLNRLSAQLGLSIRSLRRLQVGWDGEAYTFPMSNSQDQIIGIRRRFPDGPKVSVTGSKNGLFIPTELSSEGPLLICEGPSDAAAALDLSFSAIGRANCNSKVEMAAIFVSGRDVVIVGDNDDMGRAGAERLSDRLVLCCTDVRIIYPPVGINDLRDWFSFGLTTENLMVIISKTEPIVIKFNFNRK